MNFKINMKTLRMVIGIIFIINAINCVLSLISGISTSITVGYMLQNILTYFMGAYGAIISVFYGVTLLKQKNVNMLMNAFCGAYVLYLVVNMIINIRYGINFTALLLIAAFVLSQLNNDEIVHLFRKITNKIEKENAVTKQKSTIYDEQLRDNIITQEEYDQIMHMQNSTKDNID